MKFNRSTITSLVLHLLIILIALNLKSGDIIVPSRSDGMEVSLVSSNQIPQMSKIVKLQQLQEQNHIQNQPADVNLKSKEDKKTVENKLAQQNKTESIPPSPPVAIANPKTATTTKSNKINKTNNKTTTDLNPIDDLLNNLPTEAVGKSKGAATGGTNLGTSDTNNLKANYADLVIAKVRPFIINPNNLDPKVKAVVQVTLFPNMKIQTIKIIKPSGNDQYDLNIQQAIERAAVFPPLPDGAKFADYRIIKLTFKPE